MLKFILIAYPIIYFTIYFFRYIYMLNESHEYFIRDANYYENQVIYLTFDNFKNFFHLNNQKWTIGKRILYKPKEGKFFVICFNCIDFLRVFIYLSEIKKEKNNSFDKTKEKNLELLLKDIQTDIDDIKEQSKKECEEAIKSSAKIMNNIKLELQEKEDEDDAFMYEQQAASRRH